MGATEALADVRLLSNRYAHTIVVLFFSKGRAKAAGVTKVEVLDGERYRRSNETDSHEASIHPREV